MAYVTSICAACKFNITKPSGTQRFNVVVSQSVVFEYHMSVFFAKMLCICYMYSVSNSTMVHRVV